MPEKIFFRADASPEIGMGHFTRSLALADMVKDRFQCNFVTLNPSSWQLKELKRLPVNQLILKNENTHFNEFLEILKGGEIVVLDNYYFDTDYQLEIKNKGCSLVCIDDVPDKHYFADIVINHSPSVKKEMFSVESYSKLLLGLDYVLLRKEFLLEAGNTLCSENISKNLILCFGGSDLPDTTGRILDLIIDNPEIMNINVIVGSAYRYLDNLLHRSKSNPGIKVFQNLSPAAFIKIIKSSALAIVPASTVLYEMLSVKIPVITGYYIDNQVGISKDLIQEKKGIFDAGDLLKVSKKDINTLVKKALKYDLKEIRNAQNGLIDGNSGRRIRNEFEKLK